MASVILLTLCLFGASLVKETQAADGAIRYVAFNPCIQKVNCRECIQTPSCAWCYHTEFNGPRCFQPSYMTAPKDQCPEEYVYNPDNVISMISNEQLSRVKGRGQGGGHLVSGVEGNWTASGNWEESGSWSNQGGSYGGGASGGGRIRQIAPQHVNLQLRAKETAKIQMEYSQAQDYPVDLYYLMDLSKSMSDDKEKLSLLGDKLAESMRNITSKFTIGFGSFVDKVVMPYVSTLPQKLVRPCEDCVAPYGYRNHLNLSPNLTSFSRMVKAAQVSGNLDAPEGGFDAIMQAIVCREIGWREEARHLLVFSTDSSFHYAGDGKLGGIVKPNDGECHMNQEGYYSMSSYQDYPSISQINLKVKQNSINVIFAVTANVMDTYRQLQKQIEGSSASQLSNDSSNIVQLIEEQYEQISSTVEMKHNASAAVNLRFFTRCLNDSGNLVETTKCSNVKVGDIVKYTLEMEIVQCPKNPADWNTTIEVYPVGLKDKLIINLEMLCGCPCESPSHHTYVPDSDICHNNGILKCGICECNDGAYGKFCECNNEKYTEFNNTINCINPKSTDKLECSGRGVCVCGQCLCRQSEGVISGKYCECDDFSCDRHNGELCSGNGKCECGKCICNTGWSGSDCSCKNDTSQCYLPEKPGESICSGHGDCVCGACKCHTLKEGRYFGKYCEKCPTCSDRCEEFKECVQCMVYKSGPYDEETCAKNCSKIPTPESVKEVIPNEENNEQLCAYYDEDDCRFAYLYYYDNNVLKIKAQDKKECPPKVFLLGIVLGVIAAIVLIGLAILLLWKLLTTIHDRREFAKFEKERMMAKWDTGENPIYKQATSTFKNPTYAGKS